MADFFSLNSFFSNGSKNTDYKKTSKEWEKIRIKNSLSLFQQASEKVPAYKDFLIKNKINPSKIQTFADFRKLPPTTKENYLSEYPHEALLWDGDARKPMTFHSTSGSTGDPTYFQREYKYDIQRELIIAEFLKRNSQTIEGPTLFVILFGMGVWSAGMGLYTGAYLATNRNKLPVSIVSPGVNKTEALKVLSKLAPSFKQVIIAGYPPFVKDVLDEALIMGLSLDAMDLRLVFTGESLTENFRDHICDLASIKCPTNDTMNTYGTSELGPTAVETPLSIHISRLCRDNIDLFDKIYGNTTLWPTLAQFNPQYVQIDEVDNELFFTGDNSIPLLRYQSGDSGGILSYDNVMELIGKDKVENLNCPDEVDLSTFITQKPFVYIFARKNLAITLYGILIYPEYLKKIILTSILSQFLTGKFTLVKKYNSNQDQYIEINLELKKNMKSTREYEKICMKEIVDGLRFQSSEYKELYKDLKTKANPKVKLWEYEDPKYFTPGNKQTWIKKV